MRQMRVQITQSNSSRFEPFVLPPLGSRVIRQFTSPRHPPPSTARSPRLLKAPAGAVGARSAVDVQPLGRDRSGHAE